MVLQVSFKDFGKAAKRLLGDECDAYLSVRGERTIITAAKPDGPSVVVAIVDRPMEEAKKELESQGYHAYEGRWSDDLILQELEEGARQTFVAGVAYKSNNGSPGIWIDAFPQLPTQAQVLRSMYEEVKETGEIANVSFEEFVHLAEANVVIATPNELKGYVAAKEIAPSPPLSATATNAL